MNKYKNLISNTVLFGISTFGSKVLVFLLIPLYTALLTPDLMGTAELITITCNLILPIMYLGIAESVVRFGMEDAYKKSDVFSIGFFTVLAGYGVLWCFYPLLDKIQATSGYTWLIFLYVLTSAMRTVITQFVRASGFIRLYAMDGIFTTVMTITFNILFLVWLKMGITGYVLSIVLADGLSAICLFLILHLHRFLKVRGIDPQTRREMFRYAIPLVPTAVFWWVTNLSDRYFVQYLCGDTVNGLYSMAYKIPTLITLVSAFFTRAWELSAFSEYKSAEGAKFYSTVFRSYYTLVFLVASGLILLIKPITSMLMNVQYYESWQYGPFLILGVSFSCLVTFLGAIYNAAKKNIMMSVTTFVGAGINIGLNALLIPREGPLGGAQGAAFATFISFFIVFLIRAFDTRKYVKIAMQPLRIALNFGLLLIQVWAALTAPPYWILWECLIIVALVACNFGNILFVLRRLLQMLPRRRQAEG